jgi:hypothetical protein|nr:MAG TPA: hypothetical protein [Caudoviricetes sp.]
MAGYLVRNYKSVYRILPVIDNATNDFCRDCNGKIDEDNVYIPCYYNSRIWHYGRSKLIAYIPSVQRGHNVVKALKKNGVNVFDCDESDEEVVFKFNASDMEQVASLMKPKTSGAKTSPFSSKNLPKAQVDIPENELARYKSLVSKLGTSGMTVIRTANKNFLDEVLAKKLRPKYAKKPFDYKSDMKAMCLSRDTKSYIYAKGLWEDYLKFLEIAIDTYLNK